MSSGVFNNIPSREERKASILQAVARAKQEEAEGSMNTEAVSFAMRLAVGDLVRMGEINRATMVANEIPEPSFQAMALSIIASLNKQ